MVYELKSICHIGYCLHMWLCCISHIIRYHSIRHLVDNFQVSAQSGKWKWCVPSVNSCWQVTHKHRDLWVAVSLWCCHNQCCSTILSFQQTCGLSHQQRSENNWWKRRYNICLSDMAISQSTSDPPQITMTKPTVGVRFHHFLCSLYLVRLCKI